jgi:hypothetical protein
MFGCLNKEYFVFWLFLGLCISHDVQAATSYFSPSSGSITAETMSVDILVDTKGVAINNVEMVVRFPNDLLEVESTSASESIFSLWVGAPKYSNESGTLSFTAGIPTPGFIGDAGKILTVYFRVKGQGPALLTFSSAIIRANDGYGSNVFQSGTRALFDLAPTTVMGSGFPSDTLAPPQFTEYPAELVTGEQLIIHGTARPESTVTLWLQRERDDQQSFTFESDRDGRFVFSAAERVKSGVYRAWAEVATHQGNKSLPSEKIAIVVKNPGLESWMVLSIGGGIVLLLVLGYAWRSHTLSQQRLHKETLEAESSLHEAFSSLRENRKRLEMFEAARTKRKLTPEEEDIVAWLKRDLDAVEKDVEKEIEDIEGEIK